MGFIAKFFLVTLIMHEQQQGLSHVLGKKFSKSNFMVYQVDIILVRGAKTSKVTLVRTSELR